MTSEYNYGLSIRPLVSVYVHPAPSLSRPGRAFLLGVLRMAAKKAVRLTFSYNGDKMELLSRQEVDMLVPPTDPISEPKSRHGFWFEVKDDKGKTLYRKVQHDPVRSDVEVFSNDPKQPLMRVPVKEPKGIFSVVLPAAGAEHEVAFMRSAPPQGKKAATAAKEFARFPVRKPKQG